MFGDAKYKEANNKQANATNKPTYLWRLNRAGGCLGIKKISASNNKKPHLRRLKRAGGRL